MAFFIVDFPFCVVAGTNPCRCVTNRAAPAGPAHADGYFTVCGPGYGVEGPTSCAFAANVAYQAHGQNPVYAYSPVPDQVYQMECGPTQLTGPVLFGPAARRAGGNNAVVILW